MTSGPESSHSTLLRTGLWIGGPRDKRPRSIRYAWTQEEKNNFEECILHPHCCTRRRNYQTTLPDYIRSHDTTDGSTCGLHTNSASECPVMDIVTKSRLQIQGKIQSIRWTQGRTRARSPVRGESYHCITTYQPCISSFLYSASEGGE